MRFLRVIIVSLIGVSSISMACTSEDFPSTNTAAPTSVLEGIEIVKTIPPTRKVTNRNHSIPMCPRRGASSRLR